MRNGWRLDDSSGAVRLVPFGLWRLATLGDLRRGAPPRRGAGGKVVIDGGELASLDTCGAMLILDLHSAIAGEAEPILENFTREHMELVRLVRERLGRPVGLPGAQRRGFLPALGAGAVRFFESIRALLGFIGQLAIATAHVAARPGLIRLKETFVQLETVLVNAIPVVALVTFLIGVVVAYLYAMQAEKYGANIFIVDGIGLAMCRELSPIIVAVIMAGRSGSAFTAQIGAMKLNEEVDAIVTLGLSPLHVLVIPRVLALMLAMPLLVFIGDVVGIAGGLLIANMFLDVTPITFLERLQIVLLTKHVFVGLVKAPVFALFIGMIGCRLGLTVEPNARSVGENTTATVVQAIVSVIILNAIFAVVTTELGI